jgi:DNA polymerase III delta subunit
VALSRSRPSGFLEASARAEARLARPPLPPLVAITGDEPFLKEPLIAAASRAADEVETFVARPGEGDAAACARLLEAWSTATLLGGPRLIVARAADALFARGRLARLEERLDAGDPPHRLLLTLESLDGRTKLARRLTQLEALVALPPLRDAPPPWGPARAGEPTELEQWIAARARERSLPLQPAAAAELARRLGNDPARLDGVLAQLALILKAGAPVTAGDIAAHVRASGAQQLAGFEDRLRAGAAGPALELLDRMLAEGVYDHDGRLVAGDPAVDLVLRGLVGNYARLVEAHERLSPPLRAALERRPWERSAEDGAALAAILGPGGRRVFLERDLREVPLPAARAAFRLALGGLRRLRDGEGLSAHALVLRLARALRPQPA